MKSMSMRRRTVLATAGFVLLSVLLVYAMARLIGGAVTRELEKDDAAEAAPEPTQESIAEPEESADPAMWVLYPEDSAQPASVPTLTPDPEQEPEPASVSPMPTASVTAKIRGARFDQTRMDFMFVGYDASGSPDCIGIASASKQRCTLLFIPRNTLSGQQRPLYTYRNDSLLAEAIATVVPISITQYAHFQMSGVDDLVDAAGGIMHAGRTMFGTEACEEMLCANSDEMIRTATQQTMIAAYLTKIRSLGIVRFAATKAVLSKYAGGTMTTAQYLSLYRFFSGYGSGDMVYRTLPVDSVTINGNRCYRADAALVESLGAELFG